MVSYLVRTTPQGNVRVSTRSRFTPTVQGREERRSAAHGRRDVAVEAHVDAQGELAHGVSLPGFVVDVQTRELLPVVAEQASGRIGVALGVIETGESELGALARELHEELGVHIATDSMSHMWRVSAGPVEEPALLSAWLVREWQGTPVNAAPAEHDDIA